MDVTKGEVITTQNTVASTLTIERLDPNGVWRAMDYLPNGTSVEYGLALLERAGDASDFEVRLVERVTRTRVTMEVIEP